MTVNKLERFAQVSRFDHVLEHTDFKNDEKAKPRGKWQKKIFKNSNPITLELACGRGDYTLELARRNPNRNYIGVDIKGARIWKGAKKVKTEALSNVRFLRIFIEHIGEYFAENEVDEIWITFSDPFPRASDRNKRLTAPRFLAMYESILAPGGVIHFKTDDQDYFRYACRRVSEFGGRILNRVDDIYRDRPEDSLLTIQTKYEKKHLRNSKTISYLKFLFI